jgi:hypothetical protein
MDAPETTAPAQDTPRRAMPFGPVTAPGHTRRARAALPLPVRTKLEALEQDAAAALALARVASDRVTAAREEQRRLEQRAAEAAALHPELRPGQWVRDPARGPTARTWVPAPDDDPAALAVELKQATDDLERLVALRDAAQSKWQGLSRVAENARTYLGVPAA